MNRRNFLSTLIGGLAATAAVRSFPFRVFSFPKEIKLANAADSGLFFESWDDWNQRAIYQNGLGNLARPGAVWVMHPIQLAKLKRLGVRCQVLTVVEVDDPSFIGPGSSPSTLHGYPVIECDHLDPNDPPRLVSDVPDRLPGPRLNPFSQVFPNPPNVNC